MLVADIEKRLACLCLVAPAWGAKSSIELAHLEFASVIQATHIFNLRNFRIYVGNDLKMSSTSYTPQDKSYSQRSNDGLEIQNEYSNQHQPGLEHWRDTRQPGGLHPSEPSVLPPQAQKEAYSGHPVLNQTAVEQDHGHNSSIPRKFWWIVGGIVLLAIATIAGVGGGLGASLAQCHKQKTSTIRYVNRLHSEPVHPKKS